ncbi:MAG: HAD-IB family hydrolase [Planctomycetota bacterium]
MNVGVYCDVDGTLTATTSVTPLLWYRRRRGQFTDRMWLASLPLRAPVWMVRYRLNNAVGNRAIYSHYKGLNAVTVRADAEACFEDCIRPRINQKIVDRLDALKSSGARLVLVTGGIDFIIRPLAEFLGCDLIAPGLIEVDGIFTGELTREPLTGAGKAIEVRAHAAKHGIDLNASHAFGNEYADADMLGAVGHPVAVRPDSRLRRIALKNGWDIET